MMTKMRYKKIIQITAVVLLVNLGLTQLVLADPPATPASSKVITADDYNKAQDSEAACSAFSQKVKDVSTNTFKANWVGGFKGYIDAVLSGGKMGCKIVAFGAKDGIDGVATRTPAEINLGVELSQSKTGFDASYFTDAKKKALNGVVDSSAGFDFVSTILAGVLGVVSTVLAQLAGLAAGVLEIAAGGALNQTAIPSSINVGWAVIRDICNMFFILVLIIIALAAILRIESYDYRHLLGEIILMAILVNFSQIIAVTIMNFVNFIALIFMPQGWYEIYSTLMKVANPGNTIAAAIHGGAGSALSTGLIQIIYTLVATVVFLALAAMFVIRLVGLYVLIVFSPIAYVARILPATEKYSEEWWSHFIKYLMWAPVALFMIKLNVLIVNSKNFTSSDSTFNFWILCAFMAAALLVAEEAGMVGGKVVMAGVHSAQHAITHGVKEMGSAGLNYGAEKVLEKTGVELRPKKWKEGWEESREINSQRRVTTGRLKALQRKSALAMPTEFFQRYMSFEGIGRVLHGGQKAGEAMLHDADKLRENADKVMDNDKARHAANIRKEADKLMADAAKVKGIIAVDMRVKAQEMYDRANQIMLPMEAQKKAILDRAKAMEDQGKKLLAPEDYHTQKKIRHAMEEEKKNIHTDNWHELVDLFNSAVAEGKQARANAILMHLTDTYNENELVNSTRYDESMLEKQADGSMKIIGSDGKEHQVGELMKYSTTGMEDFRKQVLEKKLGMGEQGSMMIMSDVSDLAENRGHRTIMRMYETKHGRLVKKSEKDIQEEQAAENAKMDDSKVLRDGHRLIFYNETPDGKGGRTTEITPAGLTYYVTNYQAVKNRVNRNEMNASQAKAAAQNARAIFAAADNIKDKGEQREYREVMSALIDFGRSKMAEAGEESRIDTIFNRFTGSATPKLTAPGEDITKLDGYIPDLVSADGKALPGGRTYLHSK